MINSQTGDACVEKEGPRERKVGPRPSLRIWAHFPKERNSHQAHLPTTHPWVLHPSQALGAQVLISSFLLGANNDSFVTYTYSVWWDNSVKAKEKEHERISQCERAVWCRRVHSAVQNAGSTRTPLSWMTLCLKGKHRVQRRRSLAARPSRSSAFAQGFQTPRSPALKRP